MQSSVKAAWRLRVPGSEKPQEHSKGQVGHKRTLWDSPEQSRASVKTPFNSLCSRQQKSLFVGKGTFTSHATGIILFPWHWEELPNTGTKPAPTTTPKYTGFKGHSKGQDQTSSSQYLASGRLRSPNSLPSPCKDNCGYTCVVSCHLSYWVPKNGTNSKKGHWVLYMQLTCSSWVSSVPLRRGSH